MPAAPKLSLCQSFLSDTTHAEDVTLAAGAGIGALHLDWRKIAATGVAAAAGQMFAEGVVATGWSSVFGIGEAERRDDVLGTLRRAVDDAAQLGAPRVLVVAGELAAGSREDADDRCAEVLATAQPWAAEASTSLMIEPLHPIMRRLSYVHTVGHAAALAARVPGVTVCVDLAHQFWDWRLLTDIELAGSTVVTVQLSNLSRVSVDERRFELGDVCDGALALAPLVRSIHRLGFNGTWELQLPLRGTLDERIADVRRTSRWFEAALLEGDADAQNDASGA